MSVYYIDPPGPLTNTSEPIDFTTDYLVTSISIEFNPSDGNGPREAVWDGTSDTDNSGGDFSFLYRNSSHSNLGLDAGPYSWTIKRAGKWPATFRIRVKEANGTGGSGEGGGSGFGPQLTPNVYGPVAQYALHGGSDFARVYLDRTGHGYHLTKGTPSSAADLIDGETAVVAVAGAGIGNAVRLQRPAYTPALQITGDLTVTARVKRTVGAAGPLVVMSGIFGAGNQKNTLYTCSILSDGKMEVFWEATAGSSQTRQSAAGLVPLDEWCWVSFRRDAGDGHWTFGANLAYQNTTSGPLPTGGSEAFLSVASTDEAPADTWAAPLADLSIWDARLSDAQLEPLYYNAMGLNTPTNVYAGTLQPNLYTPLAQWSLRGAPAVGGSMTTVRADRSGNNRHFTSGGATRAPDAQAGQFCVIDPDMKITDAAFQLPGELTITMRALIVVNDVSLFGIGNGDGATNDLIVFSVTSAGVLGYYSQYGSDTSQTWSSGLTPPKNRWVFLSIRRLASGQVRVGINDQYQTSTGLQPATARGPNCAAGWALNPGSPIGPAAAIADVCIWGRDLSDAEMIPLYKAAMGIP